MGKGSDAELDGPRIVEMLKRAEAHHLEAFSAGGRNWFAVLAFTEDDALTGSAIVPGQLAQREPWQRRNLILAYGTEINRTLWNAIHDPLPAHGIRLTLWKERALERYFILPDCRRVGAVGRPVVMRPAYEDFDPSALILPPAA